MTEREPDHLWEELRRKLEDYGSHPSPDVWAGLEQHLAAQPAARPRRRLWLLLAACLLLLSVPAALWLHLRPSLPTAGTTPTENHAAAARPGSSRQAASPGAASPAARPAEAAATAARTAAAPAPAAQSAAAAAPEAAASYAATSAGQASPPGRPADLTASTPASPAAPARRRARPAKQSEPQLAWSTAKPATLASARPGQRKSTPVAVPLPGARGRGSEPVDGGLQSRPGADSPASAASRLSPAPAATSVVSVTPAAQDTPAAPAQAGTVAADSSTGAASSTAAASRRPAAAVLAGAAKPLASRAEVQPARMETAQQQGSAAAASTPAVSSAPAAAAAEAGPEGATELLSAPTARLLLPAGLLPAPLAGVPVEEQPRRPLPPGRWSLAVLGGPALSYRRVAAPDSGGGGELSRLVQPGLGYTVQAQLSYAASGRLRLGAGLGYAEYATRYNAELTKPQVQTFTTRRVEVFYNGTRYDTLIYQQSRDSVTGYTRTHLRNRDTYRYLTVPLRVQYRLGTAGRFSYDVLGGVALGLYLGGRTTEGNSACACEQTSWRANASPFRRSNALLTLGAAAEYALGRGWHLQLQPVLQHSLNSLTRAPEPTRRLTSWSVQTGLRFDLP